MEQNARKTEEKLLNIWIFWQLSPEKDSNWVNSGKNTQVSAWKTQILTLLGNRV